MIAIRSLILLAGLLGASGVCVGALGSHSLPDLLSKQSLTPDQIDRKIVQCEIAVRYQLFHAIAILVIGMAPVAVQSMMLRGGAWLMVFGVCLFSGGIYSVVFLDKLGHFLIIPSGGVLMIIGWLMVATASLTLTNRLDLKS